MWLLIQAAFTAYSKLKTLLKLNNIYHFYHLVRDTIPIIIGIHLTYYNTIIPIQKINISINLL